MAGTINFNADNSANLKTVKRNNNVNAALSFAGMLTGYVAGCHAIDKDSHSLVKAIQGIAVTTGMFYSLHEIVERHVEVSYDLGDIAPEDAPTASNIAKNFLRYAAITGLPAVAIGAVDRGVRLQLDGRLSEFFSSTDAEAAIEEVQSTDVAADPEEI